MKASSSTCCFLGLFSPQILFSFLRNVAKSFLLGNETARKMMIKSTFLWVTKLYLNFPFEFEKTDVIWGFYKPQGFLSTLSHQHHGIKLLVGQLIYRLSGKCTYFPIKLIRKLQWNEFDSGQCLKRIKNSCWHGYQVWKICTMYVQKAKVFDWIFATYPNHVSIHQTWFDFCCTKTHKDNLEIFFEHLSTKKETKIGFKRESKTNWK